MKMREPGEGTLRGRLWSWCPVQPQAEKVGQSFQRRQGEMAVLTAPCAGRALAPACPRGCSTPSPQSSLPGLPALYTEVGRLQGHCPPTWIPLSAWAAFRRPEEPRAPLSPGSHVPTPALCVFVCVCVSTFGFAQREPGVGRPLFSCLTSWGVGRAGCWGEGRLSARSWGRQRERPGT